MPTYTLDQLREDLDKKYGPLVITGVPEVGEVKLVQALRLSKDKRARVMAIQKELGAAEEADGDYDEDVMVEKMREIFRLISETPEQAMALLDVLGEDIAKFTLLFETYSEASQLGEA
jgi:hypothetical protein